MASLARVDVGLDETQPNLRADRQIFKVFAIGAYLEILIGIFMIFTVQNVFARIRR